MLLLLTGILLLGLCIITGIIIAVIGLLGGGLVLIMIPVILDVLMVTFIIKKMFRKTKNKSIKVKA